MYLRIIFTSGFEALWDFPSISRAPPGVTASLFPIHEIAVLPLKNVTVMSSYGSRLGKMPLHWRKAIASKQAGPPQGRGVLSTGTGGGTGRTGEKEHLLRLPVAQQELLPLPPNIINLEPLTKYFLQQQNN